MSNGRDLSIPPQKGKTCSKCGEWKPYDQYHRGTAQGGRYRYCKECRRKYDAARTDRAPSRKKVRKEYSPPGGILKNWPRDENGRPLNYWHFED